ncbi:DUF6412 domain-containing protein [Microbacterium sp. CJ88]|uniref:DUF6412 domain-containing protein n=1 Tax=Microbacterium sp. CJ88 TaxID=3445672 RepID=UPI003F65E55B
MGEHLPSWLSLLLTLLGAAAPADPGAWGLAVALVAAVVVMAALVAVPLPHPSSAAGPHPRRAMDLSSPLTQSDPDASGHPRPRAPGVAASAAS